jgi:hypothetical protein
MIRIQTILTNLFLFLIKIWVVFAVILHFTFLVLQLSGNDHITEQIVNKVEVQLKTRI